MLKKRLLSMWKDVDVSAEISFLTCFGKRGVFCSWLSLRKGRACRLTSDMSSFPLCLSFLLTAAVALQTDGSCAAWGSAAL